MALSKHITHYGPQKGFPYYNLTTLHRDKFQNIIIHSTRTNTTIRSETEKQGNLYGVKKDGTFIQNKP